MGKKLRVEGPSSAAEVKAAYEASEDKRERERLLAISMAQSGEYTTEKIANAVFRGRRTIARWAQAFREGGIEKLLDRKKPPGNKPRLSQEDKNALVDGLREGRWKKAEEIRSWLERERDVVLGLKAIYYWLARLGGSWKVPRKSHVKKMKKRANTLKRAS